MRAIFIQTWLRLRASYYFIPSLMAIGAILLAAVTTQIDLAFQTEIEDFLGWFYAGTVDGARSVLGAIAGSMISVAAVTFSLTMVAVTTAAGQYGPRLISNFMRDRANQFTLGTFLATFLYALIVLRAVSATRQEGTIGLVPSLSVLVAFGLTVVSVGVLIHFIHHIPETLNVGTLTGKVARKLNRTLSKGVFPAHADLQGFESGPTEIDPDERFAPDRARTVRTLTPGFIEAISVVGLVEWAEENGARLRLLCAPGDFLMTGDPLVDVVRDAGLPHEDEPTRGGPGASVPTEDEAADKLRSFFAQGTERTEYQNVLFLADELVEIAARALSPGVNDPFTAVNCIHWYGEACLTMMFSPEPLHCVGKPGGTPRLWAETVNFERLCAVLFGQSRQYVCGDENVARAALRTLLRLKARAPSRYEEVIDEQIETLHEGISQSGLGDEQKDRLSGGRPYPY